MMREIGSEFWNVPITENQNELFPNPHNGFSQEEVLCRQLLKICVDAIQQLCRPGAVTA